MYLQVFFFSLLRHVSSERNHVAFVGKITVAFLYLSATSEGTKFRPPIIIKGGGGVCIKLRNNCGCGAVYSWYVLTHWWFYSSAFQFLQQNAASPRVTFCPPPLFCVNFKLRACSVCTGFGGCRWWQLCNIWTAVIASLVITPLYPNILAGK